MKANENLPDKLRQRLNSLGVPAISYTPGGHLTVACPYCRRKRDITAATVTSWASRGRVPHCQIHERADCHPPLPEGTHATD